MEAQVHIATHIHSPIPAGKGEIRCLREGCCRKASPEGECQNVVCGPDCLSRTVETKGKDSQGRTVVGFQTARCQGSPWVPTQAKTYSPVGRAMKRVWRLCNLLQPQVETPCRLLPKGWSGIQSSHLAGLSSTNETASGSTGSQRSQS